MTDHTNHHPPGTHMPLMCGEVAWLGPRRVCWGGYLLAYVAGAFSAVALIVAMGWGR